MNDVTEELRERQARHSGENPPAYGVDFSLLDARRIDLTVEVTKPIPIISLVGQQICTPANLTVVAAQAKAGKSAVVGAMLAALMPDGEGAAGQSDMLGFTGQAHGGKAVVLFDTEQSSYDAWSLLKRAARRIGQNTFPENFRCYRLADINILQRRQLLAAELERAAEQCSGIHCVFLDGIADLCVDPNDPEESFRLVDEVMHLAGKYNCPIVNVLHENPSGRETGKTRGHLGSQLERKSESNLRVVKDAKCVSTIYAEHSRHASISKSDGPRFAWNEMAGMHCSISTDTTADMADSRRETAKRDVDTVFAGVVEAIKWKGLVRRIVEEFHVSQKTAERRINKWSTLDLIEETQGEYRRKKNNNRQPSPTLKPTVTDGNRQTVSSYIDS